jgi:hypothetical protein
MRHILLIVEFPATNTRLAKKAGISVMINEKRKTYDY